ncbi:MAG: helix-turn-helix transcriptional regulator, partial [Silanimonas sp.]|nr:helix-turn-helix transcriptional regulator [Silanimonas sp.]
MKTASGKAGAVQFAVEECPVKLAKIDYRSKKARNTRHARGHLQHKAMGEALRAERAALGMTQAKLAAAAGVPRQRISEIERGENVT